MISELTELEWAVIELYCAQEEITVDYFLNEFFGSDPFTLDHLRNHLISLQ
tara:strand:+ start:540 stop:692 length:153 start_codon:yes stop_codon:yes gene_type:complete